MGVFGGDRNEQTWNYNWQQFNDSFNRAYSSSRVMENVGNMTLQVGESPSAQQTEKLVVGAIAGLLILAGVKLLK